MADHTSPNGMLLRALSEPTCMTRLFSPTLLLPGIWPLLCNHFQWCLWGKLRGTMLGDKFSSNHDLNSQAKITVICAQYIFPVHGPINFWKA